MTRHFGNEQGRAALVAVLATAVVVVLALGWLAMRGGPPTETPAASAPPAGTVVLSPAATKEAGLRVEAAATTMVRDTIEAPGVLSLDERRTARIASQVEGKVLEVFVEIGDRVPAGRELAHMISPVVHEAWAAYRKAIVERRRAESALKLAGPAGGADEAALRRQGRAPAGPAAVDRRARLGRGVAQPRRDRSAAGRGGDGTPRRHQQGGPVRRVGRADSR